MTRHVTKYSSGHFEDVWNINRQFNTAANPNRWFEIAKSRGKNNRQPEGWEPATWRFTC